MWFALFADWRRGSVLGSMISRELELDRSSRFSNIRNDVFRGEKSWLSMSHAFCAVFLLGDAPESAATATPTQAKIQGSAMT